MFKGIFYEGKVLKSLFVVLILLSLLFALFLPSLSSATDMGAHITSPAPGAVISDSGFSVQGIFDQAQSKKFNLIVKVAFNSEKLTHLYSFSTENSTTWGPTQVTAKDFNNLPAQHLCDVTLQIAAATPLIPPLQSDVVHKNGVLIPHLLPLLHLLRTSQQRQETDK